MRPRIARLLRRAANRLDPPRYWGNVLTPNTITNTTASTTSGAAAIRVTVDGHIVAYAARWDLARQKVAQAQEALRDALQRRADAEQDLADAKRALDAIQRGRESA